MIAAAGARLVVASMLVCATCARAEDRAGPPAARSEVPASPAPAEERRERAAAARGTREAPRRPPPAVIVIPLAGTILLPLTLPVAQPRGRAAAPRPEVDGAQAQAPSGETAERNATP
jgi:hypothetical protein